MAERQLAGSIPVLTRNSRTHKESQKLLDFLLEEEIFTLTEMFYTWFFFQHIFKLYPHLEPSGVEVSTRLRITDRYDHQVVYFYLNDDERAVVAKLLRVFHKSGTEEIGIAYYEDTTFDKKWTWGRQHDWTNSWSYALEWVIKKKLLQSDELQVI